MAADQLSSEVGHLSDIEFPPLNPNVSNPNTKFPVAISYVSTIANEAKKLETIQRLYGGIETEYTEIMLSKQVDFINLISKGAYYIGCKDVYSYCMCTLIYDARFQINEETTKALAWISFPNLLPTYFVKECLYSLASTVEEPVQIDLATINRTKPSCARVKVQVDLKGKVRSEKVHIRYDYLPKYCYECKVQGHDNHECRNLNKYEGESNQEKSAENRECKIDPERSWVHLFRKGKARILSSGRVVGNPGSWNVVKDNRFATLTEENLAEEAFNNAASSYANGPNRCIQNNIQQRGHQGSQKGQLEASTREWVCQSFETSLNNQAQNMVERATIDTSAKQNIDDQLQQMFVNVEKEKEVNARTENVAVRDASNESNLCSSEDVRMATVTDATMGDVDGVMDANMVDKSNEDDNSDNQCDNSKDVVIFNGDQRATTNSKQAITIIHNQVDAIQVVSRHRVLHDIITAILNKRRLAE
ncbi:hypothetical protein H5410_036599 [Solanum commersonii]|uniref:DUF4283 domain-containing protein n=1 Tax=Solanum commersonii TaxID=4109 RepID=A0A9J5Y642_SOLCO|nr:hypothetical protein H5410_036599 [Solanum commersonii]